MRQSEKLRQIGLGAQLQQLRQKAGLSTRSVAKSLGISPSSVNRNELGLRSPSKEEVSALCALYGVVGEDKEALLEKVGDSTETAAWLANGVPDELASLMVLEREAVAITDVQASLIPGLAHTADYARLVLGSGAASGIDLERRVATRLGRQAMLSHPRAPDASFFIEESALHRTLGNPRVLADQLEYLLLLQRRDNVNIRVIPFDTEPSSSVRASFSVYELASGCSYVFVEVYRIGLFVTDASQVAAFVKVCQALDMSALDKDASTTLIRKIAEDLDDD
ncbi:helix-turn-helix domain-containing protein [Saccharopolyspora phatthalungensis]|uniref:Transcriptional regulator with XRE-family HTH domain n=1 Tax=Saccharopolyspora phatthalungensis TaxID=664693 RepID=A0A840QDS2_9PSEU|nr:helix-turn-helix transcriptional regulator [Saccharopolyspora phatthalungensis]MBB5155123.1 transcriptional regulator with XRE-family HTH domain [Saccharopolyspora phatthalungensis]